jgi:hypothetical protein
LRVGSHMQVVRDGLGYAGDIPVGLAITKCENGLNAHDPHWLAPAGWWREHRFWDNYTDVLAAFGDRVWPTSAFGFDDGGRPACYLDEFGRTVPFAVRPRNAEVPFRWFMQKLELWQP